MNQEKGRPLRRIVRDGKPLKDIDKAGQTTLNVGGLVPTSFDDERTMSVGFINSEPVDRQFFGPRSNFS